ncbi:MAG TPA: VWA domain-containing protein [Vicinamibacterales bacterium]
MRFTGGMIAFAALAVLIVPPSHGFSVVSPALAAFQRAAVVLPKLQAFQRATAEAEAAEPITLEVVVTDAKSRPIKDLKPGDLELIDAGETRAVDAVRLEGGGRRIIGIFLDEFHVRAGEPTTRARAALNHLVDALLRDGDMVALVKPLDPLHAITFTQDRAVIRQVIAAFEGHAGNYTPRTDFERNFMSRQPEAAEAARTQVVSAALQSLARFLGDQEGRKALIFVSEGFRPGQPRAIVYAASRNGVAIYPLDPDPETEDGEALLRSIAEQTGGAASINDSNLAPALAQALADLDQYFVLSFPPSGAADGRFHPVQVRVKRPGAQARSRSGYWAPDAKVAAAVAKAAAARSAPIFRASRSSPYIRPWIGMSRGPDGLTSVTVTWESDAPPPRNQRVASILVKAIANDGSVLFENRIGAGDVDRAIFNAPPGYVVLEMAIQSSSGAALDTDYRGISVPNLQVTRPTFATPQVFRTRTARDFAEMSRNLDSVPVASRTFSRTERLLIRAAAYGPGNGSPIITARLLNRRGILMRSLQAVEAPLPPDTVQFDVPLASLAPDEYRVELAAINATGPRDEVKEILSFRVTN